MWRSLFPLKPLQWLGPALALGAAVLLGAILIVTSGVIDLSSRKPHPDGWARFLHYTFDRSTAFHRGPEPPADLDSPVRIVAGAAYYGQVCAHCHGGPGFGQNPLVLQMRPRPQFLATDLKNAGFSPRELFRVVHAGVKYSGMPAWPATGRDDEVWHLVAFLRALPKLTPEQFRALALVAPAARTPLTAPPAGGRTHPYRMLNADEPPVTSYAYRWPVYPFGDGIALSGDPVATCSRCHGADGAGSGAFPNLTIQDATYLRRALAGYASGARQSGFMRMIASQLSPQQIAALADHYAAMPRRATDPAAAPDPLGQQLALVGDKASGNGPCAGCHGVDRAAARAYPVLEGQSAWFLANQLRMYAARPETKATANDPMVAIARRMTPAQIVAVSRYYAGRPPTVRQSFAAVAK